LPDQEVEQFLEENAVKPILIIKDELRLSLAGAQNKIPVFINNNNFFKLHKACQAFSIAPKRYGLFK